MTGAAAPGEHASPTRAAAPGEHASPTRAATSNRTPEPLRAAIDSAHRRLSAAGVPSPRHDAEALAAFVIGCPPSRLPVAGEWSAGQHTVFTELVTRRESRIPLQHLTGSAGFRYLDLAVGPGVFVPRPETEVVAGWCIDALRMRAIDATRDTAPALVVDLCTGSGAIALSIAQEVTGTVVHAVEREDAAFTWAQRNVTGSRVVLHQADASAALAEFDGLVDLVVSNPPYLPETQRADLEPEVRDHDPAAALWGGVDGLAGPSMIESAARRLLRHGGLVAVEHADEQAEAVAEMFRASGAWSAVVVRQDLAARDRFVTARRDRSGVATGGEEIS